ncbi:hypothetical protein VCHA53O466_40482 [Vibrio chagasii]|nr:hypothetical protein VCHA53O466_40482 [Vibrio chagasii]
MNKKTTENSKDTWIDLSKLTEPLVLLTIEAPLLVGWFVLDMYRGCFSIMLTLVGMVAAYQVALIFLSGEHEGLRRVPLLAVIAASGIGVGVMSDLVVGTPYGLLSVDSEGNTLTFEDNVFTFEGDGDSMSGEHND